MTDSSSSGAHPAEVEVSLSVEEVDMMAKVLLQTRRGDLGWVK